MGQSKNTSWQGVANWYKDSVGQSGNYFHQHVVLPKSLSLLNLNSSSSVLDLGCGQGVLGRKIKDNVYVGLDASPSLINYAKQNDTSKKHGYLVADITKPLSLSQTGFTHATIILALQNLEFPEKAIENAAKYLRPGGKLLLVVNHPMFRIPRQTSWEVDEANHLQYRRVNRYLSPLKIPVNAKPSLGKEGPITWSFHFPLNDYFTFLKKAGFVITDLEEWTSDKESQGSAAKMENRGRSEFPLFMAILAKKG